MILYSEIHYKTTIISTVAYDAYLNPSLNLKRAAMTPIYAL